MSDKDIFYSYVETKKRKAEGAVARKARRDVIAKKVSETGILKELKKKPLY